MALLQFSPSIFTLPPSSFLAPPIALTALPSDPVFPLLTRALARNTKPLLRAAPLSVRRSTRLAATVDLRVVDDLVAKSLIEPLDFKHCD